MRMHKGVVVVTGAASGIGKAIARRFCMEGAHVCIADLSLEAARAAARDIDGGGGTAIGVAMDVTDEDAVEAGTAQVVETYGGIDVLISNAGIQHIGPVVELALSDWRRMLAVHLDGAFLTTRACLRHMRDADRGGTIIYMGSVHSRVASPLKAPYVTAKHGLLGLCRTVAIEGARHNVRSYVICPGFVRTPLVEKQIPEQARELGLTEEAVVRDVMLKNTVDGEFTTVEDVAELAVFLAAYPSAAMTGQSFMVSHGWHMA